MAASPPIPTKIRNSEYESLRHTTPYQHQEPVSEGHPFASQGIANQHSDRRRSISDYFGQAEFFSPMVQEQNDALPGKEELGRTRSRERTPTQGHEPSPSRAGKTRANGIPTPSSPGQPPSQLPALPTSPVVQRPTSRSRSTTASSSASLTSPNRHKSRISSRDILQSALDLAQKAVAADGANDIPAALGMYRDAVAKLRSVMGRVGIELEPLDGGLGVPEPSEGEKEEIRLAAGKRRRGSAGREQEGKTLLGIHDAYVARIVLLGQMAGTMSTAAHSPPATSTSVSSPTARGPVIDPHRTSPYDNALTGLGFGIPNGFASNPVESEKSHQQDRVDTSTMPISLPQNTFPESRPVITPRITSLSAYQTLPSPISPIASSFAPENPTYAQSTVTPGHERDFSYELVEKAEMHSPRVEIVSAKSRPEVNQSNGSVPSRPSRNPLRSIARAERQDGTSGSGPSTRGVEPSSTQMNRHPSSRTLVSPENPISIVVSNEGGTPAVDQEDNAPGFGHKLQRNGSSQSGKTIRLAPSSTSSATHAPTPNTQTTPFYVLRQIKNSVTSPDGAFISRGLFVPRATWAQLGVKIPAVESKIRIMELLSESLQVVRKTAAFLMVEDKSSGEGGLAVSQTSRASGFKGLTLALDDLEALTVEIHKILAKKLGDGKSFAKPRKSNTSSISNWGSKFSKTLDKITTAKSPESTTTYNDSLIRLCSDAQIIDSCLAWETGEGSWKDFPIASRSALHSKLERISEFFADVVLRFVLQDISLYLTKYLKQSSKWLEE